MTLPRAASLALFCQPAYLDAAGRRLEAGGGQLGKLRGLGCGGQACARAAGGAGERAEHIGRWRER